MGGFLDTTWHYQIILAAFCELFQIEIKNVHSVPGTDYVYSHKGYQIHVRTLYL